MRITTVGLDADDTLWHNERLFHLTQERFAALLADHAIPDHLAARLLEAERRNLGHYGFGVKGFVLSMIETAIEVTEGRVPGSVIAEIMEAGRAMLAEPIELLPGAAETVARLAPDYRLVLITEGDLLDQERKLAQSGLGEMFDAVEIVSDKTPAAYGAIFSRHGEGAEAALMAGNSMSSDVVAPIMAGAWGVHVPHGLEWALERADAPATHPRFRRISTLDALPDLLEWIDGG
ncbi:MAG: putative hydrolase of the HAD superfamily [Rhodobacteraceae bacterium HLUCCA12]|nr:MAG: putative hydrolase of the HAD superfamily [Rhodobacteraceae bacterium HLUCCA12]